MVHPPFRWQRRYAEGFTDQVAALEERSDVLVAVENMFPFLADRFFGSACRSPSSGCRRGGHPGAGFRRSRRPVDPLDGGHAHYTLDLSHTATAGTDALEMAGRMGDGLVHLHLCDGNGASTDEHLVPGRGTQPTVEVCEMLAGGGFTGQVVLEVTTSGARTKAERDELLTESSSSPERTPAALRKAPMTPRFSDAMVLRPGPVGDLDGGLRRRIGEDWTIGPWKVHGGDGRVARQGRPRGLPPGDSTDTGLHPVAVSANFLSAPDPGPVRLRATVRKRGRRIGLADVDPDSGAAGVCARRHHPLRRTEHDAAPLYRDESVGEC